MSEAAKDRRMRPIGKDAVHKLCSGQVIVDLATSVKELLENSLDAGATLVDIKLKDSGLESIVVSDNGQGISPEDYASLCRKHWTSKISSFEDLESISTFGFRGEALSSLCAVATVTITTATRESAPMGVQLEYDGAGELQSQTPVARERGTTVQLSNMFAKWPVRLQELKKNARKEYARLVSIVEQYSIISENVRLVLSNQSARGSPVAAVRTPAQSDRLARLLAVLGAQVKPHIAHFEHQADGDLELTIEGHISKPGGGRSAGDKQYFFVNGRPCDFTKAKKLVNEMYRAQCPSRLPVYAIAITINAKSIDVNLTPDKRTILIRHEQQLLAVLRDALASVLEPAETAFSISAAQPGFASIAPREDGGGKMLVAETVVPGVVRCYNQPSAADLPEVPGTGVLSSKRQRSLPGDDEGEDIGLLPTATTKPRLTEPGERAVAVPLPAPQRTLRAASTALADIDNDAAGSGTSRSHGLQQHRSRQPTLSAAAALPAVATAKSRPATATRQPLPASKKMNTVVIGGCRSRMQNDTHDWRAVGERLRVKQARQRQALEESQQREMGDGVDYSVAVVREGGLTVLDPSEASSALSRLIHKSDFTRMSVVGQFNHGFIIARLDNDLYIIDQHASDEKYNFEMLQQRAQISSQPLIQPAVLELGVVDEGVAIEYQDRLMKNGFHVKVDDDALPGQRVRLLSQPFIDQTLFDQQDLMELIAKLCVNPESMPRCERARRMFASRACRKSTMIGDPLSAAQMKAIVRHLSELDHPWNCPHGRPTMRHLHRLPGSS
ncbi:ATP-binding mismatch repair protein [Coemansia thaxteri]|uniref:DNA mismatch repair protein PMS1 n=1 Tax=Coemansia thaxteri TaxID=2663907 RepID=A0A9W8ELQ8_9FUNG|nr:ATP-binding mismatch repair protein [Coemansia thaxteri]KAJ2488214.1 ATP-binding mismatch repair protein [Coemansia sp. RSA 2320]